MISGALELGAGRASAVQIGLPERMVLQTDGVFEANAKLIYSENELGRHFWAAPRRDRAVRRKPSHNREENMLSFRYSAFLCCLGLLLALPPR